MTLTVRPMTLDETRLIADYFLGSTPEHLEILGVDPTRLPALEAWRPRYEAFFGVPVRERANFQILWLSDGKPIGFSTADRITFGERANMHLHVIDPSDRRRGFGTECVKQSVEIYFEALQLKRLYCEPNAFNTAPNRTLQNAGFKYVKTHMTVPGWVNYHQAVTQWVLER